MPRRHHAAQNADVALKKIIIRDGEEFPVTAAREIKLLQRLHHPNIVRLREVVLSGCGARTVAAAHAAADRNPRAPLGSVYMVMDFLQHDLRGLLDSHTRLRIAHIMALAKQLLDGLTSLQSRQSPIAGLFFLHTEHIIHRDIKRAAAADICCT